MASNLASTNPYIRWCDSKGPKAGGNVHRCASTKLQLPVKQRRHLRDWIRADRMPDLVLRLMPDGDPNIFPNLIGTLPVYQLFRRSTRVKGCSECNVTTKRREKEGQRRKLKIVATSGGWKQRKEKDKPK
ncbi:hypothetical protein HZH68_004172 [Vespula germanica]|uniref:Uncharacterized protein n=1 Tax=Vespula germanica TaxID=30212 RepID=A0A834KN26_VESGE|nr:hypothetical protein HZH68_004172 [Vespula germanica]